MKKANISTENIIQETTMNDQMHRNNTSIRAKSQSEQNMTESEDGNDELCMDHIMNKPSLQIMKPLELKPQELKRKVLSNFVLF